MTQKQLTANIKLYPWYRLFSSLMIIGPILVPFMIFKGLNYSQIMLLQSISAISVFVFEVPTGSIADKISRKFSLVISSVFCSLGLFLYIVSHSFWVFALAEILFGLGMTFSSGADSALLYESLIRLDRKKEYQHHEGHAQFMIFIGQGIGSVISGFIYKFNPFSPFWISVGFIVFSGLTAIGFHETDRTKSEHNYLIHVVKSIGIAVKTPRILWTVLFAALMGFTFRSSFWLYQPYFKHVEIDVMWFGVIFFFFNVVAALTSKVLVKRYYNARPRKVLIGLGLLIGASFILPAIFVSPFALIALASQQIVRGLYQPTLRFYINHQIKDQYRATFISLVSLAASLSFALLSPLVGISLDQWGTIQTYWCMGIVSLAGISFLMLLRRFQKAKKARAATS